MKSQSRLASSVYYIVNLIQRGQYFYLSPYDNGGTALVIKRARQLHHQLVKVSRPAFATKSASSLVAQQLHISFVERPSEKGFMIFVFKGTITMVKAKWELAHSFIK